MKNTALLLVLVLAGCASKADVSKEDAYTQWHSITQSLVKARKAVLDLQESREKLNTTMEEQCKKQTPVATWAIIDEVGPKCFDTKIVEQVQRQAQMQRAQQEAAAVPMPTMPIPATKTTPDLPIAPVKK